MTRLMIALILLACWQVTWAEPLVVLAADFENQGLNQPIGVGGAALGQPVFVPAQLSAIIREGAMPTRSLALAWADGGLPVTHTIKFEFLDDLEFTNGELVIEFDIQPEIMSRYVVGLREHDGASRNFGTIVLQDNGDIRAGDSSTVLADVTYSAGEVLSVRWVHDLSARSHSLQIKGVEVLSQRPHLFSDRGIGRMLFSLQANTPDDSVLHIDNIRVTWPGKIFSDRFSMDPQ